MEKIYNICMIRLVHLVQRFCFFISMTVWAQLLTQHVNPILPEPHSLIQGVRLFLFYDGLTLPTRLVNAICLGWVYV